MSTAVEPETDVVQVADDTTVFRAFERDEFLEWKAWERLRKILRANGGSYGLAGPRGAGKSWLMLRAIKWTEEPDDDDRRPGVGLWYPSPSEYDPMAFLASLSDSLAGKIEWWYRRNDTVRRRMLLARAVGASLAVMGAAVALAATAVSWNVAVYVAAGTLAVLGIEWVAYRVWRARWPEYELLRDARIVREHARYSATQRESTEVGGDAGRAGIVGRAKRVRERQLVERPATLSSLVNDFRELAEKCGRVTGGVVIAIDELDKMSDPEKVRDLLRDIKAIFEVPRVHFLVSVSDEAARTLSLGVLSERNEFNSSFYTVLQAQPPEPEQCAELLDRRGRVPWEVSIALAVLAGGNPREVVRLAELVGKVTTAREAVMLALREEALGLRREIVTAVNGKGVRPLGQEARERAFLALPETAFEDPEEFVALTTEALEPGLWEPAWKDPGWSARFEEPWRRLLMRLAVAGRLAQARSIVGDTDLTDQLLGVITAAGQSAPVAKIVLDRNLRVEPRQETADETEADGVRDLLDQIAGQYTAKRNEPQGPKRTAALDGLVVEARRLARQSPYAPEDLSRLLRSEQDGERVMALAMVQGTAEPAVFPEVLQIVRKPETAFEQYHALRALESLRPKLAPAQRRELTTLLQAEDWRKTLRKDASRIDVADRLLKALRQDDGSRTP
ncbi:MAG TPA: P-loop NTPase fold protein [Solirubrobacteraceae bacterium]|nr:P-loop NTPase fold protein [Solirubrobacteraceae bacterium]